MPRHRDLREEHDRLARAVKVHGDRARRVRREGERSIAQNLALAGAIGWLIVLPALLGAALGRWIDHKTGRGVTFTAACLVIGVAWGMYMAWQRIKEA